MEILNLDEIRPGMKVAKDIVSPSGNVLLFSGSYIRPSYIKRLRDIGVEKIYVDEDRFIMEVYNDFSKKIEDIFEGLTRTGVLDVGAVEKILDNLLDIADEMDVNVTLLNCIREKDFYTYYHSLDVCIYSLSVGKKLGLNEDQMRDLGRGALLHDVGKCGIPDSVLLKPGRLTDDEFEIIKKHANEGYEILTKVSCYNNDVARVALEHHEKWNGTGYPLNKKNNEISLWSRIVTISDIYDALTSDRVYKGKSLPHEAAEYILSNAGFLFDPELVKIFISTIQIYPVGTRVLLSTGRRGIVIDPNKSFPLRPKVLVSHDEIIDLEKYPSIFIKSLI